MNVILHTSCIFWYILVTKQIKTQSAGCHIFLLLLSPNNSCTVLCSIRFSDYWSFLCCCWPDSARRHDSQAAWLKRLFAIACRKLLYPSTVAHINDQKLLFLVYRLTWIAQTALPAIWTQTLEGVNPVDASTSILARGRSAVVDVCRNTDVLNYQFNYAAYQKDSVKNAMQIYRRIWSWFQRLDLLNTLFTLTLTFSLWSCFTDRLKFSI